jgi:hypothetical protein
MVHGFFKAAHVMGHIHVETTDGEVFCDKDWCWEWDVTECGSGEMVNSDVGDNKIVVHGALDFALARTGSWRKNHRSSYKLGIGHI